VIVAQATRVGQLTFSDYLQRGIREAAMWTLICVSLYLIICLASFSPQDPGWSHVGHSDRVLNAGGPFGAWFADVSLSLFGYFAYLIPVMVAWSAYLVFRSMDEEPETKVHRLALRWFGFFLTLGAGCALVEVHLTGLHAGLPNGAGGGMGQLVGGHLAAAFSPSGATLFLAALFLGGFSFFSGISWLTVVDGLGWAALTLLRGIRDGLVGLWRLRTRDRYEEDYAEELDEGEAEGTLRHEPRLIEGSVLDESPAPGPAPGAGAADFEPEQQAAPTAPGSRQESEPAPKKAKAAKRVKEEQLPLPSLGPVDERPPLELLDEARKSGKGYSKELLEELSRQVELKLADFGVSVEVVAVHPGPVVTLFELLPAPGIKVSKITGLSKDIARALSTVSVRVVEVIPGKSVIGLEIPNETRETVFLSEVLSARPYKDAKSPLTLALGTNISGHPVVADLARMPHALIAGTTGSGKSVAINAMILSLLYKAGPLDVRLIMVDPKMLELSVYEGIPHLLTPVVTDMKEAANALRWCVAEMERRYKLMARLGVRNIGGYNRKVAEAEERGQPIPDPLFVTDQDLPEGVAPEPPPPLDHLPYIVVVIDELADMMMVVGKKVEELIARLAQKARASGIHLLLATQRPSVDVLTGLIKANIPTRMAFQVSSRIDSRTVLDQMGAEHLLGNGDMLYLPPGTSIPQRVHGAFVDDHEVHGVVEFLKEQGEPDYIDTILTDAGEAIPGIDPEPRGGDVEDQDPLFDEAVQIVVESRRASISSVQRRLKIGYNRAARMIEEMERIGVVGPAETNGNREVLAPPPPVD
jgi:S-DNA-T family DNA segregation ATPase FtsK/SpoIIIE